jgi:hypothetical protein
MRRLAGVTIAAALVMTACQAIPGPGPIILLRNETTTAVAIHVDGRWVGTYPAGVIIDVPVGPHGEPPVRIEARSPGGTTLIELTANASDLAGTTGTGAVAGLPCGRIELAVGLDAQPPETRVPVPLTGPCP